MIRYTLHVPELLNDGSSVDQDYLAHVERELLDIGGGFTLTHGIGAWRGEDGVYREPVRLYAVDVDGTDDGYDAGVEGTLLYGLALNVARDLDQEAVYLTRAEIGAQLITPARV